MVGSLAGVASAVSFGSFAGLLTSVETTYSVALWLHPVRALQAYAKPLKQDKPDRSARWPCACISILAACEVAIEFGLSCNEDHLDKLLTVSMTCSAHQESSSGAR